MSIEPFRKEINSGVFLIGASLGTGVLGFSFIKIRDDANQDILSWTCYDPRSGRENPRVPHDIRDQSSHGWIICNGQEVVLKDRETDVFCYTADPPPLCKITQDTLRVQCNVKVIFCHIDIFFSLNIFNRVMLQNCVNKHGSVIRSIWKNMGGKFPLMRCVNQNLPHTSGNYCPSSTVRGFQASTVFRHSFGHLALTHAIVHPSSPNLPDIFK